MSRRTWRCVSCDQFHHRPRILLDIARLGGHLMARKQLREEPA
jgi:hypothetical protein